MGNISAKFKKFMQKGDEYSALQTFYSNPELRKSLDPNATFGEHLYHCTALHYAAQYGMKHLLRIFLNNLQGNPNKRNLFNETALHLICKAPLEKAQVSVERKVDCINILLQWRGTTITDNLELEKIDLLALDKNGNSALHLAAAAGYNELVDILVNNNAPLFIENSERLTAADLASRNHHDSIALFLESKMVFIESPEEPKVPEAPWDSSGSDTDASYSGLKTQDLQEAKDLLIVETTDMLHIPLFTAEVLLKDHGSLINFFFGPLL